MYELSIPFFSAGTPEEWLKFQKNLQAIFVGQDVTTGPTQYAMAKALLKGDALSVFEASTIARGTITVTNFKLCLSDITGHVFPAKAAQTQKRYMPRYIIWGYYSCLLTQRSHKICNTGQMQVT